MFTRFLIPLLLVIHANSELVAQPSANDSKPAEEAKTPFVFFSRPETVAADLKRMQRLVDKACTKSVEIESLREELKSQGINSTAEKEEFFEPARARILSSEMRSVLGFELLGSWPNHTKPNDEEIKAATTIKEYFELKERNSLTFSYNRTEASEKEAKMASRLASKHPEVINDMISCKKYTDLSEKEMEIVVNAVDKKFPKIRSTFKNKLDEIRHREDAPTTIDRDEIDKMFKETLKIVKKIDKEYLNLEGTKAMCSVIKVLYTLNDPTKDLEEINKEVDAIKDQTF